MARQGDKTRKTATNAVAVAGSLTGLVVALTELRNKAAALLGVNNQWIGACGIVLTLGFVWAFWIWPRVRRRWRARNVKPNITSNGFRLHPYDSSQSDRESFVREDEEHERILEWIRGAQEPLLYLGGASGSGKSSLLHAYVLPELSGKDQHVCIPVRGVREPLEQIRQELLRPNTVWQNPKEDKEESIAALAHRAAAHLSRSNRRLYIIFDQFEELLILHERSSPEVTGALDFIKAASKGEAASVPTILMVMRTDYEGRVRELGLPAELMGTNKEVVQRLTEPAAEAFLKRGGLKDESIYKKLVREASNLEETRGRLRFITLNFLGLAAAEAPERVRGGRTGRGLLRGAVRAWVTEPAVREQADAVLRPMISEEETKKPMALGEIAQASGMVEREAERVLMQFERDGLVRRYQNEKDIWEISHDFVARLLLRVLDDLRGSMLVRARPWLAAGAGAAILLALAGVGAAMYARYDRAHLLWQTAQGRLVDARAPQGGKRVEFREPKAVTDGTLKYLTYLPNRRDITELELGNTNITDAGLKTISDPEKGLINLASLQLWNAAVTDAGITELSRTDTGLKSLSHLGLGMTNITDAGLSALARADMGLTALISLDVWNTRVTDAGLKELARTETGLKALKELSLNGTKVTIVGVQYLASPETGLKSLNSLYLSRTSVTDQAVKELARSDSGLRALSRLALSGTYVSDDAVKELARADTGLSSLAELDLDYTIISDRGLKELARADTGLKDLTSLSLNGTKVTNASLLELAHTNTGLKKLTRLELSQTVITNDGLKDLARPESGLTALASLIIYNTDITDEGMTAVKTRWPGINIKR